MRGFRILPRVRVIAGHRIDTDRLLLRKPTSGDSPRIVEMMSNWEVARWLVRVPFPYLPEHARDWIDRAAAERSSGTGWAFLMTLRASNLVIGGIDLTIETDHASGALGYWLGEDYWGLGYATEAAMATMQFAFEVMKLDYVTASALPDNERSMCVLRKAGLVYIDRRMEDTVEQGRVETAFFMLERTQWAGRQ